MIIDESLLLGALDGKWRSPQWIRHAIRRHVTKAVEPHHIVAALRVMAAAGTVEILIEPLGIPKLHGTHAPGMLQIETYRRKA